MLIILVGIFSLRRSSYGQRDRVANGGRSTSAGHLVQREILIGVIRKTLAFVFVRMVLGSNAGLFLIRQTRSPYGKISVRDLYSAPPDLSMSSVISDVNL